MTIESSISKNRKVIYLNKDNSQDSISFEYWDNRANNGFMLIDKQGKRTVSHHALEEQEPGVVESDLHEMSNEIIVAIRERKSIIEMLEKKFILRTEPQRHYKRNIGDGIYREEGEDQTYYHRPFLEALFFQDHAKFKLLIDTLLESESPFKMQNTQALLKCLQHTDLKNPRLLQWDINSRENLLHEIKKFEKYANELLQNEDPKAKEKGALALALTKKLTQQVTEKEFNDSDPYRTLKILQFKCDILKDLHEHDKVFAVHRGWKRFVVNALTICLTAGILNLINYVATGRKFFFEKTDTQYKVLNTQKALGVDTEQDIQKIEMKL